MNENKREGKREQLKHEQKEKEKEGKEKHKERINSVKSRREREEKGHQTIVKKRK